jgi:type IV fimbrial biogenesis protein FimT
MSVFRNKGFTLIELMITLAIAAILVTVGIPAFTNLMIKNQLSGQIQNLYGALSFARSEAIKRGDYVSVCKSNDQSTCSGNWGDGWIVFENKDNDIPAVRDDIGDPDNEEPLLRVFPALPSGYTLNTNTNFVNSVTYDRLGMANNRGTFVFCKASDESTARAIIVIPTRPRIATDTNGDGIPNKADGSNITSCESP